MTTTLHIIIRTCDLAAMSTDQAFETCVWAARLVYGDAYVDHELQVAAQRGLPLLGSGVSEEKP